MMLIQCVGGVSGRGLKENWWLESPGINGERKILNVFRGGGQNMKHKLWRRNVKNKYYRISGAKISTAPVGRIDEVDRRDSTRRGTGMSVLVSAAFDCGAWWSFPVPVVARRLVRIRGAFGNALRLLTGRTRWIDGMESCGRTSEGPGRCRLSGPKRWGWLFDLFLINETQFEASDFIVFFTVPDTIVVVFLCPDLYF